VFPDDEGILAAQGFQIMYIWIRSAALASNPQPVVIGGIVIPWPGIIWIIPLFDHIVGTQLIVSYIHGCRNSAIPDIVARTVMQKYAPGI